MKWVLKIVRFLLLLAVTGAAVGVMVRVSMHTLGEAKGPSRDVLEVPTAAVPKLPVAVKDLRPETIEIYDTFTGMIRPWERYALGFETGGRIKTLGTSASDMPLDEGDQVHKGQILARLDDRVLRARRSETAAKLEQATSNMRRARQLEARKIGAITDTEVQDRLTALALAKAQHEMASKKLLDSVLLSPVDAHISKRFIKAGESVTPHQTVFELVETDKVRLVLGVPESRIREIETRLDRVKQNRDLGPDAIGDAADREFRAHVFLVGRDRYGRKWPQLRGSVYRISETADQNTGLFDVEVLLANSTGMLRPGMVASARLVTSRVYGFRIPTVSVVFRSNRAYVYTVDREPADIHAMYWHVGEGEVQRARRVELQRWVEQGPDVIVPLADYDLRTAVIRGQHRLVDGQFVRVVPFDAPNTPMISPELPIRTSPSVSARSN